MPRPVDERQALEQERDELVAQIATDQRELAATTDQDRTRREFLSWRIKRAQNRIALIETRLAAIRIEAP
jgi:chromosome segregation ATPase